MDKEAILRRLAQLRPLIQEQWRYDMLNKLERCGATEREAKWLLDCGILWTL